MNISIFNLLFDNAASVTKTTQPRIHSVAYPGIFVWGGGCPTNSVEDRENGDLGKVAP